MNKLNHTSCPLCSGAHIHSVMECTDYYATQEIFELFKCDDCGFVFTQAVPVESEIGKYYESPDYISHSDTNKGAMNKIYHCVRAKMLQRKALLIEKESGLKQGRLLDIGTGTGYFPHTMQQRGWDVEAIEKSAQAREFGEKNFGLHIQEDNALTQIPANSFDVITLWHVMEHLEHLHDTWDKLKEILRPEGVLVIAVPNCSSFDAQIYGNEWAAYDVPRHLWHFTPQTMRNIGEQHGFQLTEYYPMPYDAFYVSILSEKHQNHSLAFLKGMWNGLRAYKHAAGHKDASSSIIYIFRKKKQ
jgi:2-polyprenyl-3-methyl-5-hydroxy-6-metoxy-1,4-benzoquinol methylase